MVMAIRTTPCFAFFQLIFEQDCLTFTFSELWFRQNDRQFKYLISSLYLRYCQSSGLAVGICL